MIGKSLVLPLVCLAALVSNAQSQDKPKPLSFEDLHNSTITAVVVYAQTFRRLHDGQIINNTNTQTITLKIGSGDGIDQTHTVMITAPTGKQVGTNSFQAKFTLNKPQKGSLARPSGFSMRASWFVCKPSSPAAAASVSVSLARAAA